MIALNHEKEEKMNEFVKSKEKTFFSKQIKKKIFASQLQHFCQGELDERDMTYYFHLIEKHFQNICVFPTALYPSMFNRKKYDFEKVKNWKPFPEVIFI